MVVERADFAIEGVFFFLLLLGALLVGFFCVVMDFFSLTLLQWTFQESMEMQSTFVPPKFCGFKFLQMFWDVTAYKAN